MEYTQRKNVNRGYRKLRVRQDAIDYYAKTCAVFRGFPYDLKRVASNQITGDSFGELDQLAYKIENSLKRLIESLQAKQQTKDWDDSFIVKESNAQYITKLEAEAPSTLSIFQP